VLETRLSHIPWRDFSRQLVKVSRRITAGDFVGARVALRIAALRAKIALLLMLKIRSIRSHYGPKFVLHTPDQTLFFYIEGSYGDYYWDHLKSIQYDFVFLDIGANQGLFTIGAIENPRLQRAYAFEPVSETFGRLQANLRLNRVTEKCRAINVAIAATQGEAQISVIDGHTGAATMRPTLVDFHGPSTTERVRTWNSEKLSEEILERGIPIVAKIDVEGFEEIVLREVFSGVFAGDIWSVFIEIDEDWVDQTVISAILSENGFHNQIKIGKGRHYDLHAFK